MPSIPAHLGNRDPLISILRTGLHANPKRRKDKKSEFAAIERFERQTKTGGKIWIYVMTPIPQTLTRHPEKLKAYLDDNRRNKGRYLPTDHEWRQGTKYSGNKDTNPSTRATATTQYTAEISGNLAHKSQAQLKRMIRQAEQANKEFLNTIS